MFFKSFLRPLIVNVVVNAMALFAVAYLLPNKLVIEGGVLGYLVVGFIIGILNFAVKPLLKAFSTPFIIMTLGLALVVINGIILFLTEYLTNSFASETVRMSVNEGVLSYIVIALIFGFLNYFLSLILKK